MQTTIVIVLTFALCAAVWFAVTLVRKRGGGRRDRSLAELEEVLRSAQLTNNSFFQSLELVQKNLESLLARAESAEQRIRNLMLQPGGERRDQYTAAALLLSEGQEPHRVAAMLNLPLPQVEIVQQLNRMSNKEKKPAQRKKRPDEERPARKTTMASKIAAPQEKNTQPVLLAELLKKAANENGLRGVAPRAFAGTEA